MPPGVKAAVGICLVFRLILLAFLGALLVRADRGERGSRTYHRGLRHHIRHHNRLPSDPSGSAAPFSSTAVVVERVSVSRGSSPVAPLIPPLRLRGRKLLLPPSSSRAATGARRRR